ncbi:MAG: DUF1738 domain-containing protein [Campylobacterales bacterium]|nr:DUF1738 domain-containing protein [Campylobacterales bacterium]
MVYLEYFDKAKKHQIETKIARSKDITFWQKNVMPHEQSEVAKAWNWKIYENTLYHLSKLAKQEPNFITISTKGVPVAMMLYVNSLKEMVTNGTPEPTGFVWYVQKAPKTFLLENNIDEKSFDLKIATAILDTAVTMSLNGENKGKVMLHADPKGGDFLMQFYEKEGFKNIPLSSGDKISLHRDNDGRYFWMDSQSAFNYYHKNRASIGQSHLKDMEVKHGKNDGVLIIDKVENKEERITMNSKTKLPYEEKIAKEIIDALEKGTAPWIKPWKGEDLSRMSPFNPITKKAYKGINFVNLSMKTMISGDPRWLTYNQAKSIGGQVMQGEKGTTIVHWKFTEQVDKVDENGKKIIGEDGKPEKETIKLEHPKRFFATVFNGSQVQGLPPLDLDLENKEQLTDFSPIEAAEEILKNSGANITHKDGNRAFYTPGRDQITLPHKEQFKSEMRYYATALHELGHWTGHESRLDRDLSNTFGSIGYAKEELRAEIASFMLSSQLGVDYDPSNHYAYIDSWVQILEDTPKEIFQASADAGKIVTFVSNLQHEKALDQTQSNELTKSSKELGFSFNPSDLEAAKSLTSKIEWDNYEKGLSVEQILEQKASSFQDLRYGDEAQSVLDDMLLYSVSMNDEPLGHALNYISKTAESSGVVHVADEIKMIEKHFNRLSALSQEGRDYKVYVNTDLIKEGVENAHSMNNEQIDASSQKYTAPESRAIDVVFEYIAEDYPMDHELLASVVNEKYNTLLTENDIKSLERVYPKWMDERSPENDPELKMADIKKMEDRYMSNQQIPEKSLSKVAENVINTLSKGSIATKLNTEDAKHLIEQYGSIQAQSGYGFTHTELDFGSPGKYMVLQREEKGEIVTTISNRDQWDKDHFVTKQDLLKKGIEDLFQYGTPYTLSDGTVLMESLSGDTVETTKSEGIYIFTGEPGKMIPTTKLSDNEANTMIEKDLKNYSLAELQSTKDRSTVISERSEMIALQKNLLLIEIRKALNEGMRGEELSGYIKPLAEHKDTPLEEISKSIDWTTHTLQHRGNEGTIGETLNTLENTLEKVYQDRVNNQSTLKTFMNEIEGINSNHLTTINDENMDEVIKDQDRVFDKSTSSILDGAKIKDEAKKIETITDLRNAAIWGQSEMLSGELSDHAYAVVNSSVEAFKVLADKIEAEMTKEPNYAEQIKENFKKLEERDKAIAKADKEAVFEEKTFLAVEFEQKEAAKRAGAKWDAKAKSWYAPKGVSKEALRDWTIENTEIKALTNQDRALDPAGEFKEALEAAGLKISGDPIMDGTMQVVKVEGDKSGKKSGRYVGHLDGVPAGFIQNHKMGIKENWKSNNSEFTNGLTPEKIAEQKALQQAKEAQRIADLEAKHKEVSNKVSNEFSTLPDAENTHPYLAEKGVKAHGLKLDERGNLVMPLKDIDGKQWTQQKININNFKMLEKGGKKEGSFHLIGANDVKDIKEFIIVEGYATGASIAEATGKPVIVAVDSGNLKPVAESIREKFPDKPILVAGDNDMQKEFKAKTLEEKEKANVGLIKASDAAKASDAFYTIPPLTKEEAQSGLTDFNDFAKHRGPKEVKKVIEEALAKTISYTQSKQKEQVQNLDQNRKNQREVVRKQNHGMSR